MKAIGWIGGRKRIQLRLGLRDLTDGEKQRGAVNALGVGACSPGGGIPGQRLEQVARAIRGEGFTQSLAFLSRQRQVEQVEHGGIIKAPLQNVVSDEARGPDRRRAQLGHGLLIVGDGERALRVAQLDRAIDHVKPRAFRRVQALDGHHEFSPLDAGGAAASNDADAARSVAVEKGEQSSKKIQAVCRSRLLGREYLQNCQRAEGHHALVGPQNSDAAVRAGAQLVARAQDLIGRRAHPIRGSGRGDFHHALDLHDPDFVGALIGGRRLRP